MDDVIEKCRENFGSPPRKFSLWQKWYVSPSLPEWVSSLDEDARLLVHFGGCFKTLQEGTITWGHVIQANNNLYGEDSEDYPGELVYSLDDNVDPDELAEIANRLFELKGTEPTDPDLQFIAEYLSDGFTRVYGLNVPASISPNLKCKISTTVFARKHLPVPILNQPSMPILVNPEEPHVVLVLPSRYWPTDYRARWKEGYEPQHLTDEQAYFLHENGMPERHALYAQHGPNIPRSLKFIFTVFFLMFLFVPILGIVMIGYSPQVAGFLQQLRVIPEEATMVELNLVSPLMLLFAWFLQAGLFFNFFCRLFGRKAASKLALYGIRQSLNGQYQSANRFVIRRVLRRTRPADHPKDYFLNYHKAESRVYLSWRFPIQIFLLLFIGLELSTLPYTTDEGLSRGKFFSFKRNWYPWENATGIDLGCDIETEKKTPEYEVFFNDGTMQDLFFWMKPVDTRGSTVAELAKIDDKLRKLDTPREIGVYRGGWEKGEPKYSKACIENYRDNRVLNEERAAFERIFSLE